MGWIFGMSRELNTGRVVWRQGGDYQGVMNVGGKGILPFQPKSTPNITFPQKFINYSPLARLSIVIYIVLSIVSYHFMRGSYQIWRTPCVIVFMIKNILKKYLHILKMFYIFIWTKKKTYNTFKCLILTALLLSIYDFRTFVSFL